ncbi:MAG: tRNA (adenosine(37)-N6)-threonylcarbamoyltransferase complex dimerization subunit type 1 TsaB [Nitrospirae bacterium]|nr:tRNA (adenosine(37)-N6)-threonylcarbamoyltransferase complex dimerization subunit type 1 TsaB [Nitrospirota bacterium]
MKVLAIDTSTMFGGVAIMDDLSGLIVEIRLNIKSTYSERLMTTIDYALDKSGHRLSDIDVFAIAIGPGSFTGLRIGLSTVKGFAYTTGRPIVSVPTLEALAYHFPFCMYPVCTMLDARKKEVYSAVFKWDEDGFKRLMNEESVKIEKLIEKIAEEKKISNEKVIFTGDGVLLYRNVISGMFGEKAIFASLDKMVPSPAQIAFMGIKKAIKREFSEPISITPFYIRRSEAELKSD